MMTTTSGASRSGGGSGRLPNLIIAGATKAGTTSVFRYLRQHSGVCASYEKELRYFLPLRYDEPIGSPNDYAARFSHWSGQPWVMEASPGYLYGGARIATAMDALLPSARVVLMLREPTARCWSFFNFMRSRAQLDQDTGFDTWLDTALKLVAAGTDQDRANHPYSGLGTGCYDLWLPCWIDTFGERLKIEFFDDLAADPLATVERLCTWLGLDPSEAAGFSYHIENRTQQFRNPLLQQAALRVNKANETFLERHPGVKRLVRSAYYRINRRADTNRMSEEARARLDTFYAPHLLTLRAGLRLDELQRAPHWLRGDFGTESRGI
jgi:hypothetical protein